jgi:hypothetical protein
MIGDNEKVAKKAVDDARIKASFLLSIMNESRRTGGMSLIKNFIGMTG